MIIYLVYRVVYGIRMHFNIFRKETKNHDSTISGDPFATSLNVSNDLFGASSIPNLLNAGVSFTAIVVASFTDSHRPFATSMKKDTAPVRVFDPFEMLNKNFSYFGCDLQPYIKNKKMKVDPE
jgi:hypothetical protein